jgi:hypothetical protein
MSLKDLADQQVRREREARGEQLLWLEPGAAVVSAAAAAELKELAQRVKYGELVVAPMLAKAVVRALGDHIEP